MKIHYICRHCRRSVGELDGREVNVSQLGLERLNHEDHQEMVQVYKNGDITIQTICDSCEQALNENPHYHELDFFIH
ncbi:anti-sigma-F factor Fin family protein [Halobacillus salinarum]|uniref:Anti-sigma-F factor Fin family protein n=1 Tax=Halobacillus salinarum TaxID=2932257 RepID=A0ABY4EKQ4_9BACI|nr:anti-sigma-F factor Fin family protein [Halobacillus salinarum]UOQ44671.1 anti-sigma-F factor Fin family protein [Halobacillus salinarum]